jgi:hypothetical protein
LILSGAGVQVFIAGLGSDGQGGFGAALVVLDDQPVDALVALHARVTEVGAVQNLLYNFDGCFYNLIARKKV